MKNSLLKIGFVAGVLNCFVFTSRLAATDFSVDVLNSSFSPSNREITVGDTVIWTNQDEDDDSHTATSDNGAWIGGLMVGFGDQFSHTFPNVGTFHYHDIIDSFVGTITVIANVPNDPITLSSPKRVGGQFQFDISGLVIGRTNIIEASTNLTAWLPLVTNVATSTISSYTNTQVASFGTRFFRVVQLP
ncbi:MAG: hypothetical protein ABIP71_11915 [Verrucomicrobiota bacterium]